MNTQQQTTQRNRIRPVHAGARWLAAILLAGAATVAPAQQVIFYDDFAAGSIDPTKWIGAGFGRQLEEVKLVSGGALLAGNISYGDIGTNSGVPSGEIRISLTDTGVPGNLLGIGASVTMLAAASQDCPTNPGIGRARAGVRSMFFNNGTSSGPGDATGDVGAGIQLVRRNNGVDEIQGFFFRCDDPSCNATTERPSPPFTLNWSVGQPRLLFIFWDPTNDQFVFVAESEIVFAPYTESDALPPNASFPLHILRTSNRAENCASGPPRVTSGFATFDDVFIVVP